MQSFYIFRVFFLAEEQSVNWSQVPCPCAQTWLNNDNPDSNNTCRKKQ